MNFRITIKLKLGAGHSGEVYKGIWQGGEIALKKLKTENQESFINEAFLLDKAKHPNIVQVIFIIVLIW